MKRKRTSATATLLHPPKKPVSSDKNYVEEFKLHCWDELPEFLKHNPFITNGYRGTLSWKSCIKSMFRLHTETGNIWTHLLGVVLFFYLMVNSLSGDLWDQPFWGRLYFLVFLAAAQYALGTSTLYHLFMCHSEKTLSKFLRLDYSGISALIVGSYFLPIFYGYYCFPFWQKLYLGCMTVVGVTLVVAATFDFFHSERFSTMRTTLYLAVAGFGVIPAIQIRFLQSYYIILSGDMAENFMAIQYRIYLMYFCYGCGVFSYVYVFPERFFPGKFNIWFHSHQLWHIFVLLGVFIHYGTMVMVFQNWQNFTKTETCPL